MNIYGNLFQKLTNNLLIRETEILLLTHTDVSISQRTLDYKYKHIYVLTDETAVQ